MARDDRTVSKARGAHVTGARRNSPHRRRVWALALLACAACTVDERDVDLADGKLLPGDGVTPDAGGSLGPAGEAAAPRLSLVSPELDFGPVVIDSPGFGAIRVQNIGSASSTPPQVAFAPGADAAFSILQNRCSVALLPEESCEVRLQFLPTSAGARSASLQVTGAEAAPLEARLSGTGLAPGDLALGADAASSPNFGGVVVGQRREASFSVINLGTSASGALSVYLLNPEFQLLPPSGQDCVPGSTSLEPNQPCTLRVAFVPSQRSDLVAATLTVDSLALGAASLGLTGVALAPPEVRVPGSVDFGSVVLGQSSRGSVRVENGGDDVLTVPPVSLGGVDAASFSILENRCSEQLPARGSCEISVQFQPQRRDAHDAELVLAPAQGEPHRVALHGVGLQPGALVVAVGDTVTNGDFDFGSVVVDSAAPAPQAFRITNTGGTPSGGLTVDVTNVSGGLFSRASPAAEGDCVNGETSLEPGQGCDVRIAYAPQGPGAAEGQLTVSSDLAGSAGVHLIGLGLAPAQLVLTSSDLIQFGQVITGAVAGADVTLRNDGDAPLDPPNVEVVPSGAAQLAQFSVVAGGCSAALAPGESCSLRVELRPTQAGAHSASLRIDAGSAGETSVGLIGRAVAPGSLTVTPTSATFSAVVNGQSQIQTFSVANPGANSGPLRFNTTNSDFELQPARAGSMDCQFNSTSLAEGAACTLLVLFDPEVRSASVSAALEITSPNGGSVSAALSASSQAPATLTGSQATQFGTVVVGAAARFTWTVRNDGDQPTGTLQLSNSNPTDYRVENNTCAVDLAPQSSCSLVIVFEPKSQNAANAPLAANFRLQGMGVSLALSASGSGRQLQQPGQACTGNNSADQCARAGDVCSFNHASPGAGAVCCNSACTNPCETCDATGSCAPRGNGASCGTNLVCSGSQCLKQTGQSCVLGTECSSTVCEPNRDICCSTPCAAGQRCTASGVGCEVIQQGNGLSCSNGTQCASGNCVDGVCCNAACGATCEACNLAGNTGTCSFQPGSCGSAGETCQARGQCGFGVCVLGTSLVNQCVLAR